MTRPFFNLSPCFLIFVFLNPLALWAGCEKACLDTGKCAQLEPLRKEPDYAKDKNTADICKAKLDNFIAKKTGAMKLPWNWRQKDKFQKEIDTAATKKEKLVKTLQELEQYTRPLCIEISWEGGLEAPEFSDKVIEWRNKLANLYYGTFLKITDTCTPTDQ